MIFFDEPNVLGPSRFRGCASSPGAGRAPLTRVGPLLLRKHAHDPMVLLLVDEAELHEAFDSVAEVASVGRVIGLILLTEVPTHLTRRPAGRALSICS